MSGAVGTGNLLQEAERRSRLSGTFNDPVVPRSADEDAPGGKVV
jgi:hypothetical protein